MEDYESPNNSPENTYRGKKSVHFRRWLFVAIGVVVIGCFFSSLAILIGLVSYGNLSPLAETMVKNDYEKGHYAACQFLKNNDLFLRKAALEHIKFICSPPTNDLDINELYRLAIAACEEVSYLKNSNPGLPPGEAIEVLIICQEFVSERFGNFSIEE